jgi:hypothetical protein
METKYSSETSVDFQQTTQRNIPEDRTLLQSRPSSTSCTWISTGCLETRSQPVGCTSIYLYACFSSENVGTFHYGIRIFFHYVYLL